MKKYKVTFKDGSSIIVGSEPEQVQDDRLSPMTYKKLKELGYTSEKWKNLTQEQANKIVSKGKPNKIYSPESRYKESEHMEEMSEDEAKDLAYKFAGDEYKNKHEKLKELTQLRWDSMLNNKKLSEQQEQQYWDLSEQFRKDSANKASEIYNKYIKGHKRADLDTNVWNAFRWLYSSAYGGTLGLDKTYNPDNVE